MYTPLTVNSCRIRLLAISILLALSSVPLLSAQEKASGAETRESSGSSRSTEQASTEQVRSGSSFTFSWDTNLKYSNFFRLAKRNPKLIDPAANPANVNLDDGDRNFDRGLASNRVDIVSEMDIVFGDFGVRGSMQAWGDSIYNQKTDNNSPFTYNSATSDSRHFPAGTRHLQFRRAELLDAFFFGKGHVGKRSASFRAGQFAQLWGESLFFGNNGIAGGMAPVDVIKALSVPNWTFKEIIRPVPQVSVGFDVSSKLSLAGYYQFMWRETRLPGSGSYFSQADPQGPGRGLFLAGPGIAFLPGPNMEAKDSGQFGVQAKVHAPRGIDLGFYAIQFHDKGGDLYILPLLGTYRWIYPENIKAYAFTVTKTIGVVNWAAEIGGRTNQNLPSNSQVVIGFANNSNTPAYPTGSSIHGNLSALAALKPNFIAKDSNLLAEIAWNRLVSISRNPTQLDPAVTRDAVGFRVIYTPTYHQVVPGWDFSFPVNFAFFPMGKSAVLFPFGPDKGGDFNIGTKISYNVNWSFSVNYTRFYGPAAGALWVNPTTGAPGFTFKQSLADRNFISFAIDRSVGLRKGRHK